MNVVRRRSARACVVGLFAVSSLVQAQRAAASHQLAAPAPASAPASALIVDHARRIARLTLHAGLPHGSQPELNFNGTSMGELELRVPTGWTVELRFENVGTARHSVRVVGDHDLPEELGAAVFANAQSPESALGSVPGTVHRVSFVASRAGRYRIACAVPAHGFAGMWIRLTVDNAIRVPATVEHAGAHAAP